MTIYFISILAISLIFAKQLFLLFSNEQNPIFMTAGPEAVRWVSIGFILVGFQNNTIQCLSGQGYAVRSFLVAMSPGSLFFLHSSFFYFYKYLGVAGIWYTFLVSDILAGYYPLLLYEYEMRYLKRQIPLIHQTVRLEYSFSMLKRCSWLY
jgi:Na+-driven multidrug efflux pump